MPSAMAGRSGLTSSFLRRTSYSPWPCAMTGSASGRNGAVAGAWVGLENYGWFIGSPDALVALRNSILWVVFLTLFTVGLGLLIAVLVDRVRYESVAKSVIFVPLAISMTAAGVIWRFMFDYQSPGSPQTGTLNGILSAFHLGPISWLQVETLGLNNIFLIIVMAWMSAAG